MTSLNLMRIDFHLTYKSNAKMKMCFYVNKNIDLNEWKIEFLSSDICTLRMKFWSKNKIKQIHIHNVYNFLLILYASIDNSFPLSMIQNQLQVDVKHVFLKNFNLHHSIWSDPARPIKHVAANQLLRIVMKTKLNFILSQNIIMWQMKEFMFIIDLIFISNYLKQKLKHCEIKPKWNQFFNYVSVSTRIFLNSEKTEKRRIQTWKNIDTKKLKNLLKNLLHSNN